VRDSDNNSRPNFSKNIEQDAFASLDVVGEDCPESFIMDILTPKHIVHSVGVEHPHTITTVSGGDVQGERGMVFENIR